MAFETGGHAIEVAENPGGSQRLYAGRVPISELETKHSNRPKFPILNIYAGLIIWSLGLLVLLAFYISEVRHPPIAGEKDLGEGILFMGTLLAAIVAFMAGAMSMLLGLVRFLWLSWRFGRHPTPPARN